MSSDRSPDVRLGAYVLPGDPTWLASSLSRYYPVLDALVVPVPVSGIGWAGRPIPVTECLDIIRSMDTRGLLRLVPGEWTDPAQPIAAETAQRQAALDALAGQVDWVLQVDNDEVLPDVQAVMALCDLADREGALGVEWPMRILFRQLRDGRYLEVRAYDGGLRFDYPGSILVRPSATLVDARRVAGRFLRPVVDGDDRSLQVTRPVEGNEIRVPLASEAVVIWHNAWGRPLPDIVRKVTTWGHASGWRGPAYVARRWLLAPWRWRTMRDFHPFAAGLWPRLLPVAIPVDLLVSAEDERRLGRRQPKRRAQPSL